MKKSLLPHASCEHMQYSSSNTRNQYVRIYNTYSSMQSANSHTHILHTRLHTERVYSKNGKLIRQHCLSLITCPPGVSIKPIRRTRKAESKRRNLRQTTRPDPANNKRKPTKDSDRERGTRIGFETQMIHVWMRIEIRVGLDLNLLRDRYRETGVSVCPFENRTYSHASFDPTASRNSTEHILRNRPSETVQLS